jgi:hypothetical protein
MLRRLRFALFVALLTGCLSEDRAAEKWESWLADHDDCESDAAYRDDAEKKGKHLIRRYELPGRRCDYDCGGAGVQSAACQAGRCQVVSSGG